MRTGATRQVCLRDYFHDDGHAHGRWQVALDKDEPRNWLVCLVTVCSRLFLIDKNLLASKFVSKEENLFRICLIFHEIDFVW